jgi:RNA polymerase sigma-70 factor (ECF subfamily)
MQKKHTFDPDKSAFSTWIYTIARNTVIDFLRTNKVTSELPDFIEDTDSNKDIVSNVDKNFELYNLKKAINCLSKDKQDLVVLRFIDELSYEEMSQILNKSEGSIRISMMRTLKELRVVLEKLET